MQLLHCNIADIISDVFIRAFEAMNVLEMHSRGIPRWNGDEWWKQDDFLWKVEWRAEKFTLNIDRNRQRT